MNLKHLGLCVLLLAVGGIAGFQFGLRSEGGSRDGGPVNAIEKPDPSSGRSNSRESGQVESADALGSRLQEILLLPAKDWTDGTKGFLDGMTAENASRYREALEAMPQGRRQAAMMSQFFEKWGELSKKEAFDYALSMQGRSRMFNLSLAAQGWAKVEPELAWQTLMEISNNGASRGFFLHGTLRAIASDDLELAAKLAFSSGGGNPSRSGRVMALLSVVEEDNDYVELVRLVNQHANADGKGEYLERIFADWGQYDYEGPSLAIQSMEDSSLATSAMGGLMKGWANSDAAGAFRYALENQSDPSISNAIPDIVSNWVRNATSEELRSIPAELAGLDNYELVMNRAVSEFALADPKLAFELANSMEDEKLRSGSVRSVMGTWARSNIDEAAAYLPSISDAEVRSQAVSTMIHPYIQANRPPEQVLALVEVAETEKQRETILRNIAMQAGNSRSGSDGEALKESLRENLAQRNDVSDRFKQQVLQMLDRDSKQGTVIIRQ